MALDPVKNFAISRVATAPSPADSGTTLVVETGDGVLFPDPSSSGDYNVVVYPNGEQPTSSNAEIVRVTGRSTDTMTITREQESTSARTIVEGDVVMLGITAKVVEDIQDIADAADTKITDFNGGWTDASETWTYASASSFTISGDKTDKYQAGDKIKLTQTTDKYFRITSISYSSPNTTVNVDGFDLYSVANATITSPYYSKVDNPQGFPQREVVLSSSGGTLSETAANFRRLLINYSADGRHSSIELLDPNNKSVSLHIGHRSSSYIYISYGNFSISGTSISFQDGYRYWRNTANGTAYQWATQSVSLGEVVGYRW